MAEATRNGTQPHIEVGGAALQAGVVAALDEVVVDDHLHLPDMFVIRMHDVNRDILTRGGFEIGARISISTTPRGDGQQTELIVGEVTAVEHDYGTQGAFAVVRGYDLSHRMCRGRRTYSYNNVTDSDIARQVAQRNNVEIGEIESSQTTYEHVPQVNMTDWEFLKARAQEVGCEVAVVRGKFCWRKPASSADAPTEGDNSRPPTGLQLVLGTNLIRFRPRVTAAEQVPEVQVRGWDPVQKQALVATAPAQTVSAKLTMTPARLASTFSSPSWVTVDRSLATQAEADAAAKSISEQVASVHAEAEGTAEGNPELAAGSTVSIGLVGDMYDGKYTITSSRHVYNEDGYQTHFVISGRQERSLLGLASLGATKGAQSAGGSKIYGVVVALVTDVNDPDKLGRVKLKFPWLSDDYEAWWARVAQLGAGKQRGAVWLPEVNDEVLVAFEHGDSRRPYVVGSLYNGVDTPMLGDGLIDGSSGAVKRRGFISKLGHKFVFFDDQSKSGVAMLSDDGSLKISLNKTKTTIKITSGGSVEISGSSEVKITSDGNISVESGAQLSLKGSAGVSVGDGSSTVTVSGSVIKLN